MEKIYNLIAELCSYVIKSCTEDFFVKYSCISQSEKQRIYALIKSHVHNLLDEKNNVLPLSTDSMDSASFSALQDF